MRINEWCGRPYLISAHAGQLARQIFETKRREASCQLIQRNWRMFVARKHYKELYFSAMSIQAALRGMDARNELRFRRRTTAAIIIQVWYWVLLCRPFGIRHTSCLLTLTQIRSFSWRNIKFWYNSFHRADSANTQPACIIRNGRKQLSQFNVPGEAKLLAGNWKNWKWCSPNFFILLWLIKNLSLPCLGRRALLVSDFRNFFIEIMILNYVEFLV